MAEYKVAGKGRYYSRSWGKDDKLQSDVSKAHLFKIEYPVTADPKFQLEREDLFGYDVYWLYMCPANQYLHRVVICPAVIVDDDGDRTGLILLRILRTRCASPELWMLVWNEATNECEIINEKLMTWLHRDRNTTTKRSYITNPELEFDEPKAEL